MASPHDDTTTRKGEQPCLELLAPFVAELVGSFVIVFTVGACGVVGNEIVNPTAIASMLMAMTYAFGPISGGQFNPAVSLACGIAGKTPWLKVIAYIILQVSAGIAAGILSVATFDTASVVGPMQGFGWLQVSIAELIYTAMLCFVFLNCATITRNNPQDDQNHFFGLAVGFVFIAAGHATGGISGALLNPAVTVGLDILGVGAGDWASIGWRILYVFFQILGAALAACLFLACRHREKGVESGDMPVGQTILQLRIIRAYNLWSGDGGVMSMSEMRARAHRFVTARISLQETRTAISAADYNPVWESDIFYFPLREVVGGGSSSSISNSVLELEVMDGGAFVRERSLGRLTVDLRDFPVDQWVSRKDFLGGGQEGELEYMLRLDQAGTVERDPGAREIHYQALPRFEPGALARVASEFIGTFMITLTVCLNVVTKSLFMPWSAAAALMCMMYSLGNVSGAHFNPAVTFGVVLSGRNVCPLSRGFAYISMQLLAGCLAGCLAAHFHATGPYKNEQFALTPGESEPGRAYTWSTTCWVELAFTFMVASVILAVFTTSASRASMKPSFHFALAAGSCITAGGFAIGAVSGGLLNPAVSWGIATASYIVYPVASPPWSNCLWYSAFQLAGGVAAALVFALTHHKEYSDVVSWI